MELGFWLVIFIIILYLSWVLYDRATLRTELSVLSSKKSDYDKHIATLKADYETQIATLKADYDKLKNSLSDYRNYLTFSRTYATFDKRSIISLQHKSAFDLRQEVRFLTQKVEKQHEYIKAHAKSYSAMLSGQIVAFPYLAGMIADYAVHEDTLNNNYNGISIRQLERKLKITDLIREKKELIAQMHEISYKLDFLLAAFPELSDFLETDYREIKTSFDYHDHDPAKDFLSKEEWISLTETQRNQLALDRYIESHQKSNWQIGRDYEMSVGYKYLCEGYKVEFTGSTQKINDLGRDLIAHKGNKTYIIQCKYWSQDKTIREKHIAQLYGTSVCYQLDHPEQEVIPVFVTNIEFSHMARRFANHLGVHLVKNFPLKPFPRIKCNVGHSASGEKQLIYHLPMDQQYDTVVISGTDEFFAMTVEEAENKGFRRAYKWHS